MARGHAAAPVGRVGSHAGAAEGLGLSSLDTQLSRLIQRVGEQMGPRAAAGPVALCAAFASQAVRRGHVCADLADPAGWVRSGLESKAPGADDSVPEALPSWQQLRRALEASPLASEQANGCPLVYDAHGRVYLERYARYEAHVAQQLRQRAGQVPRVDTTALRTSLAALFPRSVPGRGGPMDAQALAAATAVLRRLCIICGGPGTGKTTTVGRTLCLLQELRLQSGRAPYSTLLLAPTGKAARRLSGAIGAAIGELPVSDAAKASIPKDAHTVHRALGVLPDPERRFRRDSQSPLAAELVLVDEVSMLDLSLWSRLLAAIPPRARLILLGDKDQLASVEAGAVLGDVYDETRSAEFSPQFASQIEPLLGQSVPVGTQPHPLQDCLVTLTRSYRYSASSPLGQLARAVHSGDGAATIDALGSGLSSHGRAECRWLVPSEGQSLSALLESSLKPPIVELERQRLTQREPKAALAALSEHQLLCAHRQGKAGVEGLNRRIERWLEQAGLVPSGGRYYAGRPLMVLENDYRLGLFNGDVGVVLGEAAEAQRAFFGDPGEPTPVPLSRLPNHESVYACTVHKSQGSEYTRVTCLLPDADSPILTRELLYTAITRGRRGVTLVASEQAVRRAVATQVHRRGGLRQRVWEAVDGPRGQPLSR